MAVSRVATDRSVTPLNPVNDEQPSSLANSPSTDASAHVADLDAGDSDSALGSLHSGRSTSIPPEPKQYVFRNGRRYHAEWSHYSYRLPNDAQEQELLDMGHSLVSSSIGLHKAPLAPDPQIILDIGTGTGIWAVDMAETYPSADVIGIDISPIQPKEVPANCRFYLDDVEADDDDNLWYEQLYFVHIRFMALAVRDWSRLLQRTFAVMGRGGYLEIQEMVWPQKLGQSAGAILQAIRAAAVDDGLDPSVSPALRNLLSDAGFTNIRGSSTIWQTGATRGSRHERDLAANAQSYTRELFHNLSDQYLRDWEYEEVIVAKAEISNGLRERSCQIEILTIYAKKP